MNEKTLIKSLLCSTLFYSNTGSCVAGDLMASLKSLTDNVQAISGAVQGVSTEDYGPKADKIIQSKEPQDIERIDRISFELGGTPSPEAIKTALIQELAIEDKADKIMHSEAAGDKARIERTMKGLGAQSSASNVKQTLIEQLTVEAKADKIINSKAEEDTAQIENITIGLRGDPSPEAIKAALIQELYAPPTPSRYY